jgi:hypothetical protein
MQSRPGDGTFDAKPTLDYEIKLSDLLVDGEERRVGGWGERDEGEGTKGREALSWRKQQQKGEVGRAKIALERSESFSLYGLGVHYIGQLLNHLINIGQLLNHLITINFIINFVNGWKKNH